MTSVDEKVRNVIGEDVDVFEWRFRPEDHPTSMPAEAGALRRILERGEFKTLITEFRNAGDKAKRAQAWYKRVGRTVIYSSVVATLIGASFILPIDPWLGVQAREAAVTLEYLFLTLAFAASQLLLGRRIFDRWMKQRAEAEIKRNAFFNKLMRTEESVQAGELPLLPLKLEYFRRYLLDLEARYYRTRGHIHEVRAGYTRVWRWAARLLVLISVVISVTGLLNFIQGLGFTMPAWLSSYLDLFWRSMPDSDRWLLFFGTLSSTFFAMAAARSLMDLDERNSSRYLVIADNLNFLSETALKKARELATLGDSEGVIQFTDKVQSLISAEHREWVAIREYGGQPEFHHVGA